MHTNTSLRLSSSRKACTGYPSFYQQDLLLGPEYDKGFGAIRFGFLFAADGLPSPRLKRSAELRSIGFAFPEIAFFQCE
ncbi:MAG: hypothetical protein LBK44_05145 [Spirochaetales bacterium]|nr:hypothetical protein [Spirochaetales bacterium]